MLRNKCYSSYCLLNSFFHRTPGWGFHTVRGGLDPGITGFVPGLSELQTVSYTHLTLPTKA